MCRRVFSILALFSGIAWACECTEPSVQVKKDHSDVVFRGTITALRDAELPLGAVLSAMVRDTKKVAVFHVSRVWKGEVGQTVEMPAAEETSMCIGFWPPYLKIGTDLLVYASRRDAELLTSICGFHKLAKDAKDLEELGPGEEPQKPKEQKSR